MDRTLPAKKHDSITTVSVDTTALKRNTFKISQFVIIMNITEVLIRAPKPRSEETRRKISETMKGVKYSEERKANIRIGHLGKRHSPETINF